MLHLFFVLLAASREFSLVAAHPVKFRNGLFSGAEVDKPLPFASTAFSKLSESDVLGKGKKVWYARVEKDANLDHHKMRELVKEKISHIGHVDKFGFLMFGTDLEANRVRDEIEGISWLSNIPLKHKLLGSFEVEQEVEGQNLGHYQSFQQLGDPLEILVEFPTDTFSLDDLEEKIKQFTAAINAATVESGLKNDHVFVMETVNSHRIVISVYISSYLKIVSEIAASFPEVLYVERRHSATSFNSYASAVVQNSIWAPIELKDMKELISHRFSLMGEGEVIGIADTGVDLNHCSFQEYEHVDVPPLSVYVSSESPNVYDERNLKRRKIVQYVTYSQSGVVDETSHGTHVAGTICGDSGGIINDGIVPKAKLAIFDLFASKFDVPRDLAEVFQWAQVAGVAIHSNSWGFVRDTSYSSASKDVDDFMFKNPEFLVLFAAGNFGSCSAFGTVRGPSTCKNCLSVGASHNSFASWDKISSDSDDRASYILDAPSLFGNDAHEHVSYFSGVGPTVDGRFKPDLVAPGFFLLSSARGSACDQTYKEGTSMSTPVVTGQIAIIRQYLRQGYYPSGFKSTKDGFIPSGALLKALAIHSAIPLKGQKITTNKYPLKSFGSDMASDCSMNSIQTVDVSKDFPSPFWGRGRMFLGSLLYFAPFSTSRFHLPGWKKSNVHYGDPSISHGEKMLFNYCVRGGSKIPKVTLVWMDPPSQALLEDVLINDLDLFLTFSEDGMGKTLSSTSENNNVEQILSNHVLSKDTTIEVTVKGVHVPVSPQFFSLVVSGDIVATSCALAGDQISWPSEQYSLSSQSTIYNFLKDFGSVGLFAFKDHLEVSNFKSSSTNGSIVSVGNLEISELDLRTMKNQNCINSEIGIYSKGSLAWSETHSSVKNYRISVSGEVKTSERNIFQTFSSSSCITASEKSFSTFFSDLPKLASDFEELSTQLLKVSSGVKLCKMCKAGYYAVKGQGIRFSLSETPNIEWESNFVLEIELKDFIEAKWLLFPKSLVNLWDQCDRTLSIVINIKGSDSVPKLHFPNIQSLPDCVARGIFWNFAVTKVKLLDLSCKSIQGSIIAPHSIVSGCAEIQGSIIAPSFRLSGLYQTVSLHNTIDSFRPLKITS